MAPRDVAGGQMSDVRSGDGPASVRAAGRDARRAADQAARRAADRDAGHAADRDAPETAGRQVSHAAVRATAAAHRAAGPTGVPADPTAGSDAGHLREVIAIFGPTASGKSAVAEAVADRLGTEVVSADAMQVYRGLPILTNQPSRPTRLVAIRALDEEMSVGAFASLAHREIDDLVATRGAAVVSGGTGLYLRAALADLGVPPRVDPRARDRTEREVAADRAAAHARLAGLDPAAAAAVHPNDRRRLVRALELAEAGGSLVADQERLWSEATRRPTLIVGLEVSADELLRRIRERTESMFSNGVVDEVRSALRADLSRTAEKTLGFREIAQLAPADALERIVVRTRRYAAYQRKWMRRMRGIVLLDAERSPDEVAEDILGLARR
jgi:tRNA dimethylallyltransferase